MAGNDVRADKDEERRERYRELLEELRVILPGVQVLFAFLLVAPFSQRFAGMDPLGKRFFIAALIGTALGAVAFMAPTSVHHFVQREERSRRLAISIRFKLVGLVFLAFSMNCAVLVVTRFVFNTPVGIILAALTTAATLSFWYLVPLANRRPGR